MDKDDKLRLAEIHAMVKTLSVDLQFLRRHRNVLFGTPVLEFNEVCSVLHLSARQVQRGPPALVLSDGDLRLPLPFGERKPQTSRTVNGTVIMERPNNPNETKYLLIGEEEFERLLRSYYILGKGLLAFEYLCGHSDRPMYLSAEGVCEVLGITRDELDEHRLKRQIKAKVFQRQMMYSLHDLVLLAERLVRHKIRYRLSKAPRFDATGQRL